MSDNVIKITEDPGKMCPEFGFYVVLVPKQETIQRPGMMAVQSIPMYTPCLKEKCVCYKILNDSALPFCIKLNSLIEV